MARDPASILRQRFVEAIALAFPQLGGEAIDPGVGPSRAAQHGDFQCNAAMALGKRLGLSPREAAARIVGALRAGDLAEPVTEGSIAGPGFINVTLRPGALAGLLEEMERDGLGVPNAGGGRLAVVDLCGVNLAKQMHVGHLRSTVIGDTLARVLGRTGWRVLRQNHVGDWGLPIAMVTARLMDEPPAGGPDRLTLDDLDRAYRAAQRACEADEAGLAAARRWGMGPKALGELEAQVSGARELSERARAVLVRLQQHEPGVMAVWERIRDVTMSACLAVCARLNAEVLPEHSAGESAYGPDLAGVVEDLRGRGLAVEDDGALVVRLDAPQDGAIREPLVVRKRDGAFLYATTDIAAVRHRVQRLGARRVVYAVDARQGLHFRQFFAAARRAGYARLPDGSEALLEHAAFGTILGQDGRPFKTRSGENVRLTDLLDQAQERAAATLRAKNPDLPPDEAAGIARAVAVAAIRYADLSTERTRDYAFNLDRMVAFEGSTGPYLQYAAVRLASIMRKASERHGAEAVAPATLAAASFPCAHPAEKALALTLLRFGDVVGQCAESLEPHRLCQFAQDLAGSFSAFFDQCPVLGAEDAALRTSRLRLCGLTRAVLADCLTLLGIPVLDRM
ncbi:MAG: arginine--tRNA ligase [Planctomyces sp.]|nr:arginine--tRNA ligase [Planctomyces sp.]MBA4120286.1 arginine--tRNA ligase [Isosphaera sp.]